MVKSWWPALLPLELAVEHHILQVMAHAVGTPTHAELLGSVVLEIKAVPKASALWHRGVGQVWVGDLQVDVQQRQQFPAWYRSLVVSLEKRKPLRLQRSRPGEGQTLGHHLVHLGDVLVEK